MSENLQIALIQASLYWEAPEENRQAFSQTIARVKEGTQLIVLPEMFSTGFTMNPGQIDRAEGQRTLDWMKEEAARSNAAICGSVVFSEGDSYYNRFLFVTPGGQNTSYDKRHTFTLAGEDKIYSAGKTKQIIEYGGFRICPMICYDLRFPVWSRNTEGYDLLLYVANWPSRRILAWDTLLRARAIENMVYCAGVNRIGTDANGHSYNGHSAVYDCLGEQLVYSEEEAILYANLSKSHISDTRASLKFLDDRDSFTLVP